MSQNTHFIDLTQWSTENGAQLQNIPAAHLQLQPAQLFTDTRQQPDQGAYLPLVGESFDGHRFLVSALDNGALWAFCAQDHYDQNQSTLKDRPLILVRDTLKALQSLARTWRRLLKPLVIAITGSSGKTSTKEILKQVFARDFKVHATPANWNNEIGVPKTLLMLTPEHNLCLIEMGMRGSGQIHELCEIAEPDYGVITNIGPVHIGELGSQEAVVNAKWELAEYLFAHTPTDRPCLVINHDNSFLNAQYKKLSAGLQKRVLRAGSTEDGEICLQASVLDSSASPAEPYQRITYQQAEKSPRDIVIDLLGTHQALNLLCGLVLLETLQKPPLEDQLHLHVPRLSGRQESHRLPGDGRLINDSYNANPDSMRAALQALVQLPGPHLAVLGLMGELGPEAERYHQELGQFCSTLPLKKVLVVGPHARGILQGLAPTQGLFAEDAETAVTQLQQIYDAWPGAKILIKASRSAHLEDIVNGFLNAPPCLTP